MYSLGGWFQNCQVVPWAGTAPLTGNGHVKTSVMGPEGPSPLKWPPASLETIRCGAFTIQPGHLDSSPGSHRWPEDARTPTS